MRLRTLALFPLLTLPLTASATPLIDDLLIIGDGHTITTSIPALLPTGNFVGADEVQYFTDSSAMIDGTGGHVLGIVYSIVLDGYRHPLPGMSMEINTPGGFDYVIGGPLLIDYRSYSLPAYLVPGSYTFSERSTDTPFSVSITPETAPSPVPEPRTLGLLLTGLLALFLALRLQRPGSQGTSL